MPTINSDGYMDDGAHKMNLPDIRDLFVKSAPHWQTHRVRTHAALLAWIGQMRDLRDGRVWISGEFASHTTNFPLALAAYIVPDDEWTVSYQDDAVIELIDIRDVFFMDPSNGGTIGTHPSVGGLVHAWYIKDSDAQLMHRTFHRRPNTFDTTGRGYIEVTG